MVLQCRLLMDRPVWLCMLWIGISLLLSQVDAARFLLVPLGTPSHLGYFTKIASKLVDHGHKVDMIVSPVLDPPTSITSDAFRVLRYQEKEKEIFMSMPKEMQIRWMQQIGKPEYNGMGMIRDCAWTLYPGCVNVLSDQQLYDILSKVEYDLAVVDAIPFSQCFYVLPYRLGVPYVSVTTQYDPWLMGIPSLPSFVPFPMGTTYSDEMSFWQRLYNLYTMMDWKLKPRVLTAHDDSVTKFAQDKPFVSIDTLAGKSLLWLINTDNVLDFARPVMPHIVYIGGITAGPAKPLPADIASFLDNSENGAILVSFGSIAQAVPPHISQVFLAAFKRIKLSVIWKYVGEDLDAPSTVKLQSSWIPQNDILSHPNIRAFITHGGNNGQFEALYHGVPMIAMPFFADQHYNAKRIEAKGYGKAISMETLTPEIVLDAIKLVTEDASFKERTQKGSQILRSAPMSAGERAVHWMEHVQQFGGSHLRSHSLDMPFYQYWMLDILAILFLFIIGISSISICCLKGVIGKLCQNKRKNKTE